jgi:hypothetical protein
MNGRVLLLLVATSMAFAADRAAAQPDRGFARVVPSTATGIEINRQRDLWVMEVQYKPVRMAWVEFTDPESGEMELEPIWYLAYRCLPRPLPRRDDTATAPQNDLDVPLGRSMFIPEFTLMTFDDQAQELPPVQTLLDQIIPEALPVINEIERPRGQEGYPRFLDSVSLVQEVMDPVPADAETQPWIYGVATWRGVDPETDFFTIVMQGFSNGYELSDAADPIASRKAIEQRFTVLGDEFDPSLREFAFDGEPVWLYVPDEGTAVAAQ